MSGRLNAWTEYDSNTTDEQTAKRLVDAGLLRSYGGERGVALIEKSIEILTHIDWESYKNLLLQNGELSLDEFPKN